MTTHSNILVGESHGQRSLVGNSPWGCTELDTTEWLTHPSLRFPYYLDRDSWETCMQVKKQQLEPDMEQRTGSKLGKGYVKAVYCHPTYLTYIQSAKCEMLDWMKQAGIKTAGRNINNLKWHHRYGRKGRRTTEPLDESERGEWKNWLKWWMF